MAKELWHLPYPATSLSAEADFHELRGRECALSFAFENPDGGFAEQYRLVLEGVEAYKVTYYKAMSPTAIDAYGRLIDVGSSEWLAEITTNLSKGKMHVGGIRHCMITLDDGPSYEFICKSFRVERPQ
jgi:hypothetical protein